MEVSTSAVVLLLGSSNRWHTSMRDFDAGRPLETVSSSSLTHYPELSVWLPCFGFTVVWIGSLVLRSSLRRSSSPTDSDYSQRSVFHSSNSSTLASQPVRSTANMECVVPLVSSGVVLPLSIASCFVLMNCYLLQVVRVSWVSYEAENSVGHYFHHSACPKLSCCKWQSSFP